MGSSSVPPKASPAPSGGASGKPGPLSQVHVILVEPQGPRNVGATARVLRNFGLEHLTLVGGVRATDPSCLEMAVHAKDILRRAAQVATLEEALSNLTFVVGSTAKRRSRLPTLRPREAAPLILQEAERGRVGLLFGREDHGLAAAELAWAHAVISIETAPECRALNISQAVLILAYELFLASKGPRVVANSSAGQLMTGTMRGRLQGELLAALTSLRIMKAGNHIPCRQSVERILALGPMQTRDARILFTLARRVQQLARATGAPPGEQPASRR